jgi:hypothetical protein
VLDRGRVSAVSRGAGDAAAERDAPELSRRRDNRRLTLAVAALAALLVAAAPASAWVR